MKKVAILLFLIVICIGCKPNNSAKMAHAKAMCDELFDIIDKNDAGLLPDSIFKRRADSLNVAIDFCAGHLTVAEWDSVKLYKAQLLNELILKKVERDKALSE